jgi:predicted DNA-binding protein
MINYIIKKCTNKEILKAEKNYIMNKTSVINKKNTHNLVVNLKVSPALEEHLDYLATVSKRSKDFIVKEALIRYLEDAEDLRDVLERSKKENEVYTTKELLIELGLNGKE